MHSFVLKFESLEVPTDPEGLELVIPVGIIPDGPIVTVIPDVVFTVMGVSIPGIANICWY